MIKKYKVYSIVHKNKVIYIGRTNNLKRREYEHNYNLRMEKSNLIYDYLREEKVDKIVLKQLYEYNKKIDSKRMEMYLILDDYFNDKFLKQKVPSISDR